MRNLKVGDILHGQWGYNETNNDYFIVTELVGAQSVKVCRLLRHFDRETSTSTPILDGCRRSETTHKVYDNAIRYDPLEFMFPDRPVRYRTQFAFLWDGKPNYVSWEA